ncbi:MAG TPA: GNAT family N-acetyltransferase [Gammaproteobacteria bacterium]
MQRQDAAAVVTEAGAADLDTVRELFTEYQRGLGVDLCFQGFADELATLPGDYAAPRGALWIARLNGVAVGCVGLRPTRGEDAELKRLYVRPAARGHGLGKRLTLLALARARDLGYAGVVLDTLPSMRAAQALYRAQGFAPVDGYYATPLVGTLFYRCPLR